MAYAVALGLFLAVGRETTGKIPPGKVINNRKLLIIIANIAHSDSLNRDSRQVLKCFSETLPTTLCRNHKVPSLH